MTDGLVQPRTIELSFPWNVHEVIAAERQAFNRFCRPVFRILLYEILGLFGLGFILGAFALAVGIWKGTFSLGELWPFIFILALASYNSPFLRHLKFWLQPSPSSQGEMRWLVTDEFLEVSSGSRLSLKAPWNSISEIGRSKKGFVVFLAGPAVPLLPRQPGSMTYLWLPSHAFRHTEDLSAFERLVGERSRVVAIN